MAVVLEFYFPGTGIDLNPLTFLQCRVGACYNSDALEPESRSRSQSRCDLGCTSRGPQRAT